MHNTWLVIRREYLERIRSKAFIIMTLLMPVFMASTILIPALLADMKSGVTRHIVVVANNTEIADAVGQELTPVKQQNDQASRPKDAGDSANQAARRFNVTIDTNVTEAERDKLRGDVSSGKIDGFLWLSDADLSNRKVLYSAKDVTDFGESMEMRNAVHSAVVKQQLAQKGMFGSEGESLLKP